MAGEQRLFWLDLEMSGLDSAEHRILEAAGVITTMRLVTLDTFETAVFQEPEVLAGMDDWCKQHHGASGLTARVSGGVKESALDQMLCEFADRYFQDERIVLAGNSIAHDRRFVDAWLPEFSARLHHRMLDVSSYKLVFEHLFGVPYYKQNNHRALEDILESIAELRYYIGAIDPSRLAVR